LHRDRRAANKSLDAFDVGQCPASVEVGLGRRVEAEQAEPAAPGKGRQPVAFLAGGRCGAEKEIHGAVRVRDELLARVEARQLVRGVDKTPGFDVVEREGPELLHRRIGRNAQGVAVAALQPLAVLVLLDAEIRLPLPGRLRRHPGGQRQRFVEVGRALVQGGVVLGLLVRFQHDRVRPLPAGPGAGFGLTLGVAEASRHGFPDHCGLRQDLRLACIGPEWPSLLDAERLDHRHHHAVSLMHGLLVEHLGEQPPELHAVLRPPAPLPIPRRDDARFSGILALRVRVCLVPGHQGLGRLGIGNQHAERVEDIVRGGLHDSIFVELGDGGVGRMSSGIGFQV
jgi:hypothetical protein